MYERAFGLSTNPFRLTPDAGFYFASATHARALATLDYGLQLGEGFVVLTGEVGSGKTMLIRTWMASVRSRHLDIAQLSASALGPADLLRLVLHALGLPGEHADTVSALTRIDDHLKTQTHRGRRVVLVVDEAQNLGLAALEQLRLLTTIQTHDRAMLQVFLVGQPELHATLARSEMNALRQRITAAARIDRLSPNEVGPYIEHRLGCVGWQQAPTIEHGVFEILATAAEGIPRRINRLADRLLLAAWLDETRLIDMTSAHRVVIDLQEELQFVAGSTTEESD